jgi:hypothetical protein
VRSPDLPGFSLGSLPHAILVSAICCSATAADSRGRGAAQSPMDGNDPATPAFLTPFPQPPRSLPRLCWTGLATSCVATALTIFFIGTMLST